MKGKVWLVGAGPGDLGLFTIKGREILQQAEVVVYDRLVGESILNLIPREAECIDAGKRAGNHTMPQEQIVEKGTGRKAGSAFEGWGSIFIWQRRGGIGTVGRAGNSF